jgi:HD-GYP domain-containing protein (c-di-GMP phosphodiesterase class II)
MSLVGPTGGSQSKEVRDRLMEEARVHALGKALVSRFAMLLKTARIHSVQNAALQYSVKIFVDAANNLVLALGDFMLRGDVDSAFINDMRIRAEALVFDNVKQLLSELADRQLGGMHITGTITPIHVRTVLDLFLRHRRFERDGARILNEKLQAAGIDGLRFLPRVSLVLEAEQITGEAKDAALAAVHAYTQMVATWKTYMGETERDVPEVITARLLHTVQAAVDMLHEDPGWFLAASNFRRAEDLRAVHACNVCVLSIGIGMRLELGRKALMNLGMAALFADSGLRRVPKRYHVVALTGGQPGPELARHPYESVKEVLHTPALTRAQRDRIMVGYEHHVGRDGRGYPPPLPGKGLHLFSAIVSIADRFLELTTELPGVPAMTQSRALEVLAQEEATYDGRLLRIFFHMMGPFPTGSVVRLGTGEVAVVVRQAEDGAFRARPTVKIVRDPRGVPVKPVAFDLTSCDGSGDYLTSIVDQMTPKESGIDVVRTLFLAARAGES